MTRFLVTGGSGFIGSALVRSLVTSGHSVFNFDRLTYASVPGALDSIEDAPGYELVVGDIADQALTGQAFRAFEPDVVVNLAAETHVDRSIDDDQPFIHTNVVGVGNLLRVATDWWTSSGRKDAFRFIHVSTDEVFGSIADGAFTAGSPYRPSSPYAASKAAGDHLVRAWGTTHGLPTIVTTSSNNYGPFQHPEKLIPMMAIRAVKELSLPIYGDGLHERDWIHVDDHVAALVRAAEGGRPGETYLIGTGVTHTNLEIVRHVCRLVDERLNRPPGQSQRLITSVGDRPGHDRRYCIDATNAAQELAWAPSTTLDRGLATTVGWYCDQADRWEQLDVRDALARRGLGR